MRLNKEQMHRLKHGQQVKLRHANGMTETIQGLIVDLEQHAAIKIILVLGADGERILANSKGFSEQDIGSTHILRRSDIVEVEQIDPPEEAPV